VDEAFGNSKLAEGVGEYESPFSLSLQLWCRYVLDRWFRAESDHRTNALDVTGLELLSTGHEPYQSTKLRSPV